jgi:hypothetical protein
MFHRKTHFIALYHNSEALSVPFIKNNPLTFKGPAVVITIAIATVLLLTLLRSVLLLLLCY